MKLLSQEYAFTLLTPAMIGGALGREGDAEMRSASIRGQVRWWHRKAGLTPECNQVWGQTDGTIIASRVGLAISPRPPVARQAASILPHHPHGGGSRDALDLNQSFTLVLTRLVGCSDLHWEAANKAVKIWLLLGGIGLRSNRAAGSVWPEECAAWTPPNTKETLMQALRDLFRQGQPAVALIGHGKAKSAVDLRKAASDTVNDSDTFGAIQPHRKPSPTKFKVVNLGGLCLLAYAPNRQILENARRLLVGKPDPHRWLELGQWVY